MTNPLSRQGINVLILVPLLVMSYHIWEFFSTVPPVFRIGLAVSFDLLVIVVFQQLKDRYIQASDHARRVTWATLYVMIGFQLYVNIWAFWHLAPARAVASGVIFPLIVGLISYINMLRDQAIQEERRQLAAREETEQKVLGAESPAELALLSEQRPFEGEKVDKALVIKAYAEDQSELSMQRFAGAKNWRSVKRWWEKLTNGEKP